MENVIAAAKIVELFCLVISALIMLFALRLEKSRLSNDLFLTIFPIFVMNLGYLLELLSNDIGEVFLALRFEYIGTSVVSFCALVFTLCFCRIAFPGWLKGLLGLWHLGIIIIIWTNEYHHLYYTKIYMDGLVFGHEDGILYFVEKSIVAVELIIVALFSCREFFLSMLRKKNQSADKNSVSEKQLSGRRFRKDVALLIGVSASTVFLLIFLLGSGFLNGIDPVPALLTVAALLLTYAINSMGLFSGRDVIHGAVIKALREPVIILDGEGNIIELNDRAKLLYPEEIVEEIQEV